MRRPSLHIHTTHTRDAALLKLKRVNRWLIMGSIVLTSVLADVAANAFPGKTKTTAKSAKNSHHHTKRSDPVGVLAPPERAPESSSGEGSSGPPSEGSASEGSSEGESPQSGEAPSPETSAPESSSEGQPEAQSEEPSAESSGPVVSGGS